MSKKILFFTGGAYVAGLEIMMLTLIRGLKDKGNDVRCVINGWNDGDFKNRLSEIDVPYYEVKLGWLYLKKPTWTFDTLINYPKAYITCKKVLKDFKPDVVNFTSYAMPIMLYPLIKANSFYTLHDTQLPYLKHRIIYKLLKKKIGTFIAVSNHIADILRNLSIPNEKIKVIYNGVAAPDFLLVSKKMAIENTFCFAIIGQIIGLKGHGILINSVELLAKKGITNFKVFIIGNNNNDYSKLLVEQIAEKNITSFFVWKGFIKNKEEIYSGIDAVIIPSLCTEAFSLTTAETMIRGLGVIASNLGGIKELIDPGENGLLFKVGDAEELSECMDKLMQERGYNEILGVKAKKKALTNFTDQAMTDNYLEIYT